MSENRPPLITRLWRACLLLLGSVFCVWLAFQLLAQIWVAVAIILGIAALITGLIWWLRIRANRW
ncbi:hypothetical protein [Herbiconiux liangxiaofengii]|uniref:hypothetical protein n=1 Tax=Herbiconiux liangxiaofengii TaxID=3342795 RepID=UPI0035B9FCE0